MHIDLESEAAEIEELKELAQSRPKILIVDDDPLILSLLEVTLASNGHEVVQAKDGNEAVTILEKSTVALIICDQFMPGMTGIEVMQRAQDLQPDAVRIMLTGHKDSDMAINAINIGHVQHFITKPWNDTELGKTVSNAIDQFKLVRENQLLQKLTMKQHKKLEANHQRLRQDLQLGARIQEKLLIGSIPSDIEEISFEATSIPSADIDGDFFDFYRPSKDILDVVVGDVMGKGIAAALVGTAVKSQLVRFALAFSLSKVCEQNDTWKDDLLEPHEVMKYVHDEIAPQLLDLEYFVTLFYARFNLQDQMMTYVDCGSTKPLHYKAKEKKVSFLKGDNLPLGVVAKADYLSYNVYYSKGDIFVFYSDAVTEAKGHDNELFGMNRFIKLLEKNAHLTSTDLAKMITHTVLEFAEKGQFDDDLTLIVMKMVAGKKTARTQVTSAKFKSELSQAEAVRSFVHRLCQHASGDKERLSQRMQLAINEAFCNIVKHGYGEDNKGTIIIDVQFLEEGVEFQVSDQGKSVDPARIHEPDLAGDRFGGFGWYMIREIADKTTYTQKKTENGWNHLSIFKQYLTGEKEMKVAHQEKNQILVITPEGQNLDARDAPEFKKQVMDLITEKNARHVVLDLHQLQFIDSSGLGSFLSVLKALNTQGGDLKLSCMNNPIRTMFELVSMHKIFEIFNTTDDAISSFQ